MLNESSSLFIFPIQLRLQLIKVKTSLEKRLNELVSQLTRDKEEISKQLAKIKTEYEAKIADLHERLEKEQEVIIFFLILCSIYPKG